MRMDDWDLNSLSGLKISAKVVKVALYGETVHRMVGTTSRDSRKGALGVLDDLELIESSSSKERGCIRDGWMLGSLDDAFRALKWLGERWQRPKRQCQAAKTAPNHLKLESKLQ